MPQLQKAQVVLEAFVCILSLRAAWQLLSALSSLSLARSDRLQGEQLEDQPLVEEVTEYCMAISEKLSLRQSHSQFATFKVSSAVTSFTSHPPVAVPCGSCIAQGIRFVPILGGDGDCSWWYSMRYNPILLVSTCFNATVANGCFGKYTNGQPWQLNFSFRSWYRKLIGFSSPSLWGWYFKNVEA